MVTNARPSIQRAYARENGHDLIIYDTAGRLHIDEELMQELKDVATAVKPREVLLVVDAMSGQDSVNVAKEYILCNDIEILDMDHDAGDYAKYGGDYIRLLDWLEETGRNYPIRIHSMNPVGVANMRAIIQRNGWKEVK